MDETMVVQVAQCRAERQTQIQRLRWSESSLAAQLAPQRFWPIPLRANCLACLLVIRNLHNVVEALGLTALARVQELDQSRVTS